MPGPDEKPDTKPEQRTEQSTQNTETPTRLSDAGNTSARPPENGSAARDTRQLQDRGVLPSVRLEVAPGVAVGDKVNLGGDRWTAAGNHQGKVILFQQDRGATFAGEFKTIEGKPDPSKYTELSHFEGQPKDTHYYADKRGNVYKTEPTGDGKSVMSSAHDVRLADPKDVEKPGTRETRGTSGERETARRTADTKVAEEPKVGERVEFNGEKLKVGAVVDGKALLYEQGRHDTYAIVGRSVTDTDLKTQYDQVKVNIDGKEQVRYLSKGEHPTVYMVSDLGGSKTLYQDHSFEVAKTSELAAAKPGTPARVADTTGDKPSDKPDTRRPVTADTEAAKLPAVGEKVTVKGERLSVAGYEGNHALLQQPGRHSDYAVMMEPVTDTSLKTKYQEVKVNIDGKEATRYVEKGHPERGVYKVSDFGGNKSIYQDHSFEVVPKTDVATGGTPAVRPTEKPAEKPTEKPVEKPAPERQQNEPERAADAKVRETKMKGQERGSPADERVRLVDGKEVKVRTPQDGLKYLKREVEIDGKTIELARRGTQQWYYSQEDPSRAATKSGDQVKMHVTGVSGADLGRLQKELLPVLEEMRKKGDVQVYKTFDPNFGIDGKWQDHPDKVGSGPGPAGQNAKAFTIYVSPDKVQEVAKAIDKILKEKGLTLKDFEGDNVGELTRKQSESKRVSIERDMLNLTETKDGRQGGQLDKSLSDKIHDRFGKSHGVDSEGHLSEAGLRAAEKAAGVKAGQLGYDKDGKLMFLDANGRSEAHDSKRFYASEYGANKEPGRLTGRPAMYALYAMEGLDPAKVFTDQVVKPTPGPREARPERVVASAERLRGTESRVGSDGSIDRRDARTGEQLAREQLNRRDRVEQKEIDAMKLDAERLARSEKEVDKEKAAALRKTVDALEGRLGLDAQEHAHRAVLAESRRALERGEGGGYGKAVVGGLIGVTILAGAALAYYRSTMKDVPVKPIERARVNK